MNRIKTCVLAAAFGTLIAQRSDHSRSAITRSVRYAVRASEELSLAIGR